MKRILAPVFIVLMAAPVFADAEDFGERMLQLNGSNTSPATLSKAAEKLSGDRTDERLPFGDAEIVSRTSTTLTAGHLQLARSMGVDPQDYTLAELSAMYIGKYD